MQSLKLLKLHKERFCIFSCGRIAIAHEFFNNPPLYGDVSFALYDVLFCES
jgi:hypothetical protein